MSFSTEWEERYAANTHLSIWPWSDVVSLVHRHCKPLIASGGAVLELGCGAGANIPLFLALGVDYYAIDGSQTIVHQLHDSFPNLKHSITQGDFTVDHPFSMNFDLVLDRASLTHNDTESIRRALNMVFESLVPGGIFIGVDWFSKNHSDAQGGESVNDDYTRIHHTAGQFTGVGKVHFSDEAHLRDLLRKFDIVFIEEKLTRRHEPQDSHQFASWNIVARKPRV